MSSRIPRSAAHLPRVGAKFSVGGRQQALLVSHVRPPQRAHPYIAHLPHPALLTRKAAACGASGSDPLPASHPLSFLIAPPPLLHTHPHPAPPAAHQGPRKADACGASGSGHIQAMRPRVMAAFSTRLRGSAPVGTCDGTATHSSTLLWSGRGGAALAAGMLPPCSIATSRSTARLAAPHPHPATPLPAPRLPVGWRPGAPGRAAQSASAPRSRT